MFVKKTDRFFAVTSMIVCCCCTATVFISYIKRSNIRMLCLGPLFLAAAIVLYIALKRCEKKLTKKLAYEKVLKKVKQKKRQKPAKPSRLLAKSIR